MCDFCDGTGVIRSNAKVFFIQYCKHCDSGSELLSREALIKSSMAENIAIFSSKQRTGDEDKDCLYRKMAEDARENIRLMQLNEMARKNIALDNQKGSCNIFDVFSNPPWPF